MTPAEAYASHQAFLAEGGEPQLAIRRVGLGDVPVLGKAVAYDAKELAGSVQAGDIKFVVLCDDAVAALGLVTKADRLVRGSKEMPIKKVDAIARRFFGVVVALEIWVSA